MLRFIGLILVFCLIVSDVCCYAENHLHEILPIPFQGTQLIKIETSVLQPEYRGEFEGKSEAYGEHKITRYSPEEKELREIYINEQGLFVRKSGDLVTSDVRSVALRDMDYYCGLIAVTPSGEIFLDFKSYDFKHQPWRHSSTVDGEPVLFAGEAGILDGKLMWISNESGHYLPTKIQTLQFLELLYLRGVDLSNVEVQIFQKPRGGIEKKKYDAEVFLFGGITDSAERLKAFVENHQADRMKRNEAARILAKIDSQKFSSTVLSMLESNCTEEQKIEMLDILNRLPAWLLPDEIVRLIELKNKDKRGTFNTMFQSVLGRQSSKEGWRSGCWSLFRKLLSVKLKPRSKL